MYRRTRTRIAVARIIGLPSANVCERTRALVYSTRKRTGYARDRRTNVREADGRKRSRPKLVHARKGRAARMTFALRLACERSLNVKRTFSSWVGSSFIYLMRPSSRPYQAAESVANHLLPIFLTGDISWPLKFKMSPFWSVSHTVTLLINVLLTGRYIKL